MSDNEIDELVKKYRELKVQEPPIVGYTVPYQGEDQTMESGSIEAIFYEFCHLLDEILHGLENITPGWIWGVWRARFCNWTHRND